MTQLVIGFAKKQFFINKRYGPLIKTKDSILINTSKLSKKACFLKIKKIIDKKLKIDGNI